jgi:eukaryotic-like serine/threonine-protein kinase
MTPGPMPVDVGQIVANKYELLHLLGRGSMGEVWSAHHRGLDERVALKVLCPPRSDDAEEPSVALARFRFEAQVAARLSRKTRHIARVTDYGEDNGLPYLVMELLDGEALDATLRARGRLPLAEVVEVVSQIARALYQAHAEGVAHRDLKPANVFLAHDEEGRMLVKLLDFGIARTLRAHPAQGTFSTGKGFVFGTPGYMSPEQIRASPALDHRCDLWALATIGYQMLTGKLPVDGDNADEVLKNVSAGRIVSLQRREPTLPAAVDAFFERAFADRVEDRFAGAASLAQAFELAAGGGISRTFGAPSPDSSGTTAIDFAASVADEPLPRSKRTTWITASAGALLFLVAAAGARAALHDAPHATAGSVAGSAAVAPATPAPPRTSPPVPESAAAPPPAPTAAGSALPLMAPPAAAPVRRAAPERPSATAAIPSPRPTAPSSPSASPPSRATVTKAAENRDDVF